MLGGEGGKYRSVSDSETGSEEMISSSESSESGGGERVVTLAEGA